MAKTSKHTGLCLGYRWERGGKKNKINSRGKKAGELKALYFTRRGEVGGGEGVA